MQWDSVRKCGSPECERPLISALDSDEGARIKRVSHVSQPAAQTDAASPAPSALSACLRRDLRWALRSVLKGLKACSARCSRSALASVRSRRLGNMLLSRTAPLFAPDGRHETGRFHQDRSREVGIERAKLLFELCCKRLPVLFDLQELRGISNGGRHVASVKALRSLTKNRNIRAAERDAEGFRISGPTWSHHLSCNLSTTPLSYKLSTIGHARDPLLLTQLLEQRPRAVECRVLIEGAFEEHQGAFRVAVGASDLAKVLVGECFR